MNELHDSALCGMNKTFWLYHRRSRRIAFFRDYNQPWHVIAPRNYTLRLRGPNNQYFFWVKRGK